MNETIMIAIIMILCIALAVAALILLARKQTRKQSIALETELNRLIESNQLNIDNKEVFRNRIIAIDKTRKMLVYVKLEDSVVVYDLIDLEQVTKCDVAKLGTTLLEPGKKALKTIPEYINAIHLQLHTVDKIIFDITIYSEIEDGASEILKLDKTASEWCETINLLKRS